jgi:hypothetical protein
MSDLSPRLDESLRPKASQTITDRVLARVADVGHSLDRRARATRPKASRHRASAPGAAAIPGSTEQLRELRSLRRVFSDLGLSYRQYRRETGAPVSPDVRSAAERFRRELNVAALVGVASCLDSLDILTW